MSITRNSFQRPAALFAAAAVLVGVAIPAFLSVGSASAADQVTSRSIQMSDSAPSGGSITSGVGSGTAVKYILKFTTASAVQSIVVDFCGDTPLIGDTACTAPDSFTTSGATLTANGTWSLATTASQWKLTNTSSQAAGTFTFEINGITNPTRPLLPAAQPAGTPTSFFARVTTYADATYGTYTSTTAPGNYVEYGGIALSTTRPITITAKVMETLSFCTSAADLTALSCAGATPPAISIGTGVNNDVIDYTAIYKRSAYSQVSTNASNGYAVYMRAHNTCGGGLSKDNGTTCGIPAINSGAASASLMSAGTAAFGVDVADGVAVAGGTGSNTAGGTATRWNPGTANNYIMDEVTATDNVKYTYGSKVIESAGQANSVTNVYEFAATASPVTPAGIYTQAFSLIAVGVF